MSRVLNNEPNVRRETREKVKQAVHDLNYTPDVSARSLAGHRSYMLALFYDTISEGYLSQFQRAALDRCREAHYHLVVERCSLDSVAPEDRLVDIAAQLRVDGVVLLPPLSDQMPIIARFKEAQIPAVLVAPGGDGLGTPTVWFDDFAAALNVMQHLIRRGHRRIGFVTGHPAHGAARQRFAGYRQALDAVGIPFDPSLVVEGRFDFASGLVAAQTLLNSPDRPTAIFASNDEMAAAVVRAAQERSLAVPQDVSVVGFDDSLLAEAMSPPLTTVRQPVEDMAMAAIDLLLETVRKRLAGDLDRPDNRTFGHAFKERASVLDMADQSSRGDTD